ncbi:MAG: hypothetical protein ACI9JN_000286 [Bacteroidia bacterium]|jgi:hypothetical protein
MKTTFTLLTILALSMSGMDAQAAVNSKLHLNLFSDGNFVVVVDGIRYSEVGGTLAINNLNAGTHRVKIVEVFGRHGRGGGRNAGREILYDGSLNIPFNSAVFARLTDEYNLRVTEVKRLRAPVQRRSDYRDNRRRSGQTYGRGNRNSGYNAFMATKRQMRQAAFDRNKLAIAKRFIRSSRTTSAEVGQLMRLMAFDSNKLELAKFSYGFVIDKRNFRQVRRSLTFDDSVRRLDRFIANQHHGGKNRRR